MVFIFVFPGSLYSDEIEGLIEQEKDELVEWAYETESLPSGIFLGDQSGVEIYSEFMSSQTGPFLCDDLELTELVELTGGRLSDNETHLNFLLDRVRDEIGNSCTVRPGDSLRAIGPGWQTEVKVHQFTIKRAGPTCRGISPYALWVSFEKPLRQEPLFFHSSEDIPANIDNHYRGTSLLPLEKVDQQTKKLLNALLLYSDEYRADVYRLDEKNSDALIHLVKKSISLTDEGLPHELLINQLKNDLEILEMEKVDSQKGSGGVELQGVLDFNQDGWVDLWVQGTQAGCVYKQLFMGKEGGFEPIFTPSRPCRC